MHRKIHVRPLAFRLLTEKIELTVLHSLCTRPSACVQGRLRPTCHTWKLLPVALCTSSVAMSVVRRGISGLLRLALSTPASKSDATRLSNLSATQTMVRIVAPPLLGQRNMISGSQ